MCKSWPLVRFEVTIVWIYPGFQRIFFLIDNEAALKQKKAARRKKKKILLGALRLVNAASPRTISVHKKKISSGTQGSVNQEHMYYTFFAIFISLWLFCFDWTLTGLTVSEFYAISSRENMIIFLTANRVFTDVGLNFEWFRLAPVTSSQGKRSYNRLLSEGKVEQASVKLSCL